MKLRHLDLPTQQTAMRILPQTLDIEAGTVEVTWSTGATVRRSSFFGEYDEALPLAAVKLERLNAGAPLLDTHLMRDGIGAVIGTVEPGTVRLVSVSDARAVVRFDIAGDAGKDAFRKVQDRILTQLSCGYDADFEIIERANDVPLLRALSWTPFELSVVPVGADQGTAFRSSSSATRRYAVKNREVNTMPDPKNVHVDNDTTTAFTVHAGPPGAKPEAPAPDTAAAEARAAAGVLERMEAALTASRVVGITDPAVAVLAAKECRSVAEVKARFLDLQAQLKREKPGEPPINPTHTVEVTRDVGDKTVEMLGLALMHRTLDQADPSKVRSYNERLTASGKASEIPAQLTDETGRRMRRARLIDVAESFLRARGIHTAAMSPGHIAETALAYRSGGSMMTTADFAGLLANTANKMLSIGYSEVTSPWRDCGIARRVDRPDFKTFTMYRRAGAPGLARINESGAIKRSGWADGTSFTAALQTAGVEVAFTRQMLINDDLEAFAQQNLGLGDSAVRWEDDEIVTTLLYGNPTLSDGTAMFDSSRGNLSTDVGAPDFAAIVNAAHMFGAMTETVKDPATNNGTKTRKIQFSLTGFLCALTEKYTIDQILQPRYPDAASNKLPSDLSGLKTWRDDRLQVEASAPDVHFALSNRTAIVYGGLTGDASPRLSSQVVSGVDGVLFQLIHDWYYGVEDPKAIIRIPKS